MPTLRGAMFLRPPCVSFSLNGYVISAEVDRPWPSRTRTKTRFILSH